MFASDLSMYRTRTENYFYNFERLRKCIFFNFVESQISFIRNQIQKLNLELHSSISNSQRISYAVNAKTYQSTHFLNIIQSTQQMSFLINQYHTVQTIQLIYKSYNLK